MPPLWHTIEMPPGCSVSISRSAVENVEAAGSVALITPTQFGPQSAKSLSAAIGDQRPLQFGTRGTGLRQAARIGDAMADADVRAFCDRREECVRRNREDRKVGSLGKFCDTGKAVQALDWRGGPIDRPHAAGIAELEEPAHGFAAQIPRLIGGSDDRDRARFQDRRDVRERSQGVRHQRCVTNYPLGGRDVDPSVAVDQFRALSVLAPHVDRVARDPFGCLAASLIRPRTCSSTPRLTGLMYLVRSSPRSR